MGSGGGAGPMVMQLGSAAMSAGAGMYDSTMGNIAGMLNFWKDYRAATRKRLATRNVPARYEALARGDYKNFWKPIDPASADVDRAFFADLFPGGGGVESLLLDFIAPGSNPNADNL